MARPELIAFDCYGTLVINETSDWVITLGQIAEEQGLGVDGPTFHAEWTKYEVNFRKTRTNMSDPANSPPFRTYWEAWRDAFVETFEAMGLDGDADAASTRCVDHLCLRKPFPETSEAITALNGKIAMGVMSNADDRFLVGALENNGWSFDPVISSETARAYKPDPRAFGAICKATGVAPDRVLYVGDSAYDDAHGAKAAGMTTVLIRRNQDTPGRTPPPDAAKLLDPDHVVSRLTELPALLDSLS